MGLWYLSGFALYQKGTNPEEEKVKGRRYLLPAEEERIKKAQRSGRLALAPIVAGTCAGLIVIYFLLDILVETRNEQFKRKVKEIAGAVKDKNTEAIVQHLSATFQSGPLKR